MLRFIAREILPFVALGGLILWAAVGWTDRRIEESAIRERLRLSEASPRE